MSTLGLAHTHAVPRARMRRPSRGGTAFKKGNGKGVHTLDFTISDLSMVEDLTYSPYKPGQGGWKDVFVRGYEAYIDGLNKGVDAGSHPLVSITFQPVRGARQTQKFCKWSLGSDGGANCTVVERSFAPGKEKLAMNYFGSFQYSYPDAQGRCNAVRARPAVARPHMKLPTQPPALLETARTQGLTDVCGGPCARSNPPKSLQRTTTSATCRRRRTRFAVAARQTHQHTASTRHWRIPRRTTSSPEARAIGIATRRNHWRCPACTRSGGSR